MKYLSAILPGVIGPAVAMMLTAMPLAAADAIYRYQDEHGHWHFGDKKPVGDSDYKKIEPSKPRKKNPAQVRFRIDRSSQPQRLIAENLLFAPVTLLIDFEGDSQDVTTVLKPQTQHTVYTASADDGIPKFKYRYLLGDTDATPDSFAYVTPFAAFDSHRITQAFNGRFSHRHDGSRYAIDIQLPVGTYITAAREGIVVLANDKFVIGGVSSNYFLDKANRVLVIHDDGSFATYVHLLPGSIIVKPGDKVAAGDVLARSASTGFSSGPHLHFAVLKATANGLVSVPFQLRDSKGIAATPVEDQLLLPARKPPT